MEVRQAVDGDAERIVSLLRNFHAAGGFDFPFDAPRLHAFVLSKIRAPNGACFVVGRPVFGVLVASHDESAIGPFRYAWEHQIWVEPDMRGTAWTSLRKEYEAWAKRAGCNRVLLSLQHHIRPHAMARLYRRDGYRPGETIFVKDI